MPELRRDPVVGRWVIISTERGKRPSDFEQPPQCAVGDAGLLGSGLAYLREQIVVQPAAIHDVQVFSGLVGDEHHVGMAERLFVLGMRWRGRRRDVVGEGLLPVFGAEVPPHFLGGRENCSGVAIGAGGNHAIHPDCGSAALCKGPGGFVAAVGVQFGDVHGSSLTPNARKRVMPPSG